MTPTHTAAAVLLLALGTAAAATAQGSIPLTLAERAATGRIALPGGLSADLTIVFEDVSGLDARALDVSATFASPIDPLLLRRLPPGSGLASGFPVLLRIEPGVLSALWFRGVVAVSLHTHNLSPQEPPLALFSAPLGGAFTDITAAAGVGSYRVRGSGPKFSEFLIAVDGRPQDAVVLGKFDRLQSSLSGSAPSIPADLAASLQSQLTAARSLYAAGQSAAAAAQVSAFSELVRAQSGAAITDVWRAHDARVNVAGLLRSGADTLLYSLTLGSPASPLP